MPSTRAAKVEAARLLREEGLSHREIARTMRRSIKTVHDYFYDPSGEKLERRKEQTRRLCPECGRPMTAGVGPAKQPQRCLRCHNAKLHAERRWTGEAIIAAIREFAETHERAPYAHEWLKQTNGVVPSTSLVIREFGSWNNGIAAAGFKPRRPGDRPSRGLVWRSTEELIEEIRAISRFGIAPSTAKHTTARRLSTTLRRRGITWEDACAAAGVKPYSSLTRW